jgi:hypothetical protein
MLNPLTVSAYLLPPPVISPIGLFADEPRSQVDPLGRLAEAAALIAKSRAALKKQSERLEKFYSQAGKSKTTFEELEEAAQILLDSERQLAATLAPQIEKLEQNLARKRLSNNFDRSLRRWTEEWLDIGQTWLELYQNLRIRLLKLASDRRAAAGETGSPIVSDADEMERYLRRITGG